MLGQMTEGETRVRRSQRSQKAAIVESDSENEKEESDASLSGESDEEPKKQPKRQVARRTKPEAVEDVKNVSMSKIFNTIAKGGSPDAVINAWARRYRSEDKVALCTELLDFFFQTAGYPANLMTREFLDHPEDYSISDCLEAINQKAGTSANWTPNDYPIISKKYTLNKTSTHHLGVNKFAKNLATWWTKWTVAMASDLFDPSAKSQPTESQVDRATEASYLWQVIQTYIVTLSSSHIRNVRHTATFVAMAICNGLANVAKQSNEAAKKLQDSARQLPDGSSKRQGMEEQVDLYLHRAKVAEKELDTLFDRYVITFNANIQSAFVNRYRDVDPLIRVDCQNALGHWILTLPSKFLEPTYLKYNGWMMGDKEPEVRLASLRPLRMALERDDAETVFHRGLKVFLERFHARLLEMASLDPDGACREEATRVCVAAAIPGLLGDSERIDQTLLPFIVRFEPNIRDHAAHYFAQVVEQETEKLGEVMAASLGNRKKKLDANLEEQVQIKALINVFSRAFEGVENREGVYTDLADDKVEELPSGPRYLVESAVMSLSSKSSEAGQVGMFKAVDALWNDLSSVLSRHEDMIKFLVQAEGQDKLLYLKPKEELLLMDILVASIQKDIEQTAQNTRDEVEASQEIGRKIINSIDQLIRRSGVEAEQLSRCMSLLDQIHPELWSVLRLTKTLDGVLHEISRAFCKVSDNSTLLAMGRSLKKLATPVEIGNKKSKSQSDGTIVETTVRAVERLVQEVTTVQLANALHHCQNLISHANSSVNGSATCPTANQLHQGLTQLKDAVNRCHVLDLFFDVSKLQEDFGKVDLAKTLHQMVVHGIIALADCQSFLEMDDAIRLLEIGHSEDVDLSKLQHLVEHVFSVCCQVLTIDMQWTSVRLVNDRQEALGDALVDKLNSIIENSTTIMVGDPPLGSLAIRSSTGALLLQAYLATVNPTASQVYDVVNKVSAIPIKVQHQVSETFVELVASALGIRWPREEEFDEEEEVVSPIPTAITPLARSTVNHYLAMLCRAMEEDVLDPSCTRDVFLWIGVGGDIVSNDVHRVMEEIRKKDPQYVMSKDALHTHRVLEPAIYSKLTSPLLKTLMEGMESVWTDDVEGNLERVTQVTFDRVKIILNDIVLHSLISSVNLFFDGHLPGAEHTEELAKMFVEHIRTWSKRLLLNRPSQDQRARHEGVYKASLEFCLHAGLFLIEKNANFISPSRRLEGNKAWKAICTVVQALMVQFRPNDNQEILQMQFQVNRLVEQPLKESARENGLRVTNAAEWDGYHTFFKAIYGTADELEKKKKTKATSRVGSRVASVQASRVVSRVVSRDTTPKPRAKPLAFEPTKLSSAIVEASDEEIEDVESDPPSEVEEPVKITRPRMKAKITTALSDDELEDPDVIIGAKRKEIVQDSEEEKGVKKARHL